MKIYDAKGGEALEWTEYDDLDGLKNFIKKSPDFRAIRAEIVERFCFSNANSEAIMCLQHSSGECDCCSSET